MQCDAESADVLHDVVCVCEGSRHMAADRSRLRLTVLVPQGDRDCEWTEIRKESPLLVNALHEYVKQHARLCCGIQIYFNIA